MNDDQLNNLKEFIGSELSLIRRDMATKNELAAVRSEMATKQDLRVIHDRLDENDVKQDEILNAIGEVLDGQGKALHIQASHVDDHERRLTHLEKRAA
jgi:hypothetical protein